MPKTPINHYPFIGFTVYKPSMTEYEHYDSFGAAFKRYQEWWGVPKHPFVTENNGQYEVRDKDGNFLKLFTTFEAAISYRDYLRNNGGKPRPEPAYHATGQPSVHTFIEPEEKEEEVTPSVTSSLNDYMGLFADSVTKGLGIPKEFLVSHQPGPEPTLNDVTKHLVDVAKAGGDPRLIARQVLDAALSAIKPDDLAKFKSMEELAQAMFYKIGGMPEENSIENLLRYMHDQEDAIHTRRAMDQLQMMEPGNRENFMDEMISELEDIAGVVGLQPLLNDYPDSASMIIKLDMKNLSEGEAMYSMEVINEIIKTMKPPGLQKFEVIYHTKEVY